ncbi:MAG TPA: hypothetical protein VK808_12730 [Bacteroidia bacterium]|jgi:hypothetical protein|nr:hypothetical protein [Bacteroidia bacterium]
MSAILIKSTSKAQEDFFLAMAKMMHASVKLLNEEEELDALLINSIEKGMKSGEASKNDLKKFFKKHGIQID